MDAKNIRDLKKLVSLCRKEGVSSLKLGEIELSLSPSALFPQSPYKQKKSIELAHEAERIQIENSLSEEDILFWSSAGIPELERAQ